MKRCYFGDICLQITIIWHFWGKHGFFDNKKLSPSDLFVLKMAALQKVEKFDEFKKLLLCALCKTPPRPGSVIYSCTNRCAKCDYIECEKCAFLPGKSCRCGYRTSSDSILTKFVSFIKLYNCINLKHGCQEELEAKELETHEEICLFRKMICPKLDCNQEIAYHGILEHYQGSHPNFKMKEDVLEFKGSLEDLKKNSFILLCYGKRPFYPQFYVKENLLHFWVVGHGSQVKINSFEVRIRYLIRIFSDV